MKKLLGVFILLVVLVLTAAVPVGAGGGECPPCLPGPPPPCAEGCTPGYWKQEQHFDSWRGYSPSDLFDLVFGVDSGTGMTLLEALSAKNKDVGSGPEAALMRHAVAALLNAANGDVNYGGNESWVKEGVALAYDRCEFECVKDVFESYNERYCPLN